MNPQNISDQTFLDTLFPASVTDAFFDALFGEAEEGAYDIKLIYRTHNANQASMAFQLLERPGHCLRCNLTYGLPQVFARHPVLNVNGLAQKIAQELGWDACRWELGHTEEHTRSLHCIPFTIYKESE